LAEKQSGHSADGDQSFAGLVPQQANPERSGDQDYHAPDAGDSLRRHRDAPISEIDDAQKDDGAARKFAERTRERTDTLFRQLNVERQQLLSHQNVLFRLSVGAVILSLLLATATLLLDIEGHRLISYISAAFSLASTLSVIPARAMLRPLDRQADRLNERESTLIWAYASIEAAQALPAPESVDQLAEVGRNLMALAGLSSARQSDFRPRKRSRGTHSGPRKQR
jgi:hypothetical protein